MIPSVSIKSDTCGADRRRNSMPKYKWISRFCFASMKGSSAESRIAGRTRL